MRRAPMASVMIPLLALAAGCGVLNGRNQPEPTANQSSSTTTAAASPDPTSGASTSAPTAPRRDDDLADGRAQHVIRSSGIAVTVDYETRKPDEPWTAIGDKPLRVEVKVTRPTKKVYLNRVTLRFAVDDGSGLSPGPDPLIDTSSNISPGFLVAPPYSYVQSFAVPEVDPSTVAMAIDVKLEFVSLVDPRSRDYTKQTVTDRLVTDVTS